jgi:hypothetical protein
MSKFGLVKSRAVWKNKHSVEEIDYSILLTHVFGRPIRTEQAFMYLFRRHGLPNGLHDDYKDLCAYTFHTNEKDIIVRWCMNQGDYHHHLCAFTDFNIWAQYANKPYIDWHKQLKNAAEKDGGVYFGGGLHSVYRHGKDNKMIFIGNEIQRKYIDNFLAPYSRNEAEKAWDDLYKQADKNDEAVREKYKIPYPKIESKYGKSFVCQFDRQVEAGKEQDEWIRSLPEGHFLRRVYFATMSLFENWKRPTYIRDVHFDMTCERTEIIKRRVEYTNFYSQLKEKNDAAE